MEHTVFHHHISMVKYPVGAHYISVRKAFILIASCFFKKIPSSEIVNKNINLFCRGSSGLITASIFAEYALSNFSGLFKSIRIIDIKKPGESAHGKSLNYIGDDSSKKHETFNIIIDDFISSGETIDSIIRGVQEHLDYKRFNWNDLIDYKVADKIEFHALIVSGRVNYWFKDIKYVFGE